MSKKTINKGADPNVIFEFLLMDNIKSLKREKRKEQVKMMYSDNFGRTSKSTIKANVREDIVILNQKNRVLVKLPQDLKKLDIMAVNYNNNEDIIEITFAQQKGNSGSFNSSSESKTLESIAKCVNDGTIINFFDLIPNDNLNPNKCGKKYRIDVCIGMVNACGNKKKYQDGVEIKYLSNNDYLLYLGLEISIVQLALQVERHSKVLSHTYDAISECSNWDSIYDECENELNYD